MRAKLSRNFGIVGCTMVEDSKSSQIPIAEASDAMVRTGEDDLAARGSSLLT